MGTSKFMRKLRQLFSWQTEACDFTLDLWIRDAFLDDAFAQPSPGAWERLRMALAPRRTTNRSGMWVLNEPLRDPPESQPMVLTYSEFQRAQRLYVDSRPNRSTYFRDTLFGHSVITFPMLLNL